MMEITVNCGTSLLGQNIDNGKTIICQGLFKQSPNRLILLVYYLYGISDFLSKIKVPFGDAVISTLDTCIGVELCEELFAPAR